MAALVCLGAALLVAMVLAIQGRGPWYDEFFTLYVTRPKLGLTVLWPVWLHDNHPATFYFLAWTTNFLGDSLAERRLVNLAFVVTGGGAMVLLCRCRPSVRSLVFPYLIALASYLPMIDRVSELRSNFLAYISVSVAIAALTGLASPKQSPQSFRALAFLSLALMVSFNVHLAATLIVGAISAAFGVRLLLMQDWRGAGKLLIAGVIAGVPFAGFLAVQMATIAHNTKTFWVPAGLDGARWAIEKEIVANFSANWPFTLAGLAGLTILGRQALRDRRLSERASLAVTLGAGTVIAIALLLAIHLERPFIVDRYLVALNAPIAMCLAIGVAAMIESVAISVGVVVDLAMTVAAMFAIHAHLQKTLAQPSWNGTGSAIARIVADCPGTVVHIGAIWNEPVMAIPPAENRAVFPYGYAYVARSYGFKLAPSASTQMAKQCPTVFWTEHVADEHPTADMMEAALRQRGFAVHGGAVHGGRIERIGRGWLYVVPPMSAGNRRAPPR